MKKAINFKISIKVFADFLNWHRKNIPNLNMLSVCSFISRESL